MVKYPKPEPPNNYTGTKEEFWDTNYACVYCNRICTLRYLFKHLESKICADWLQINLNKFHKENKNFNEEKYIQSLDLKHQERLLYLESVKKYGDQFFCNPYYRIEQYNKEHNIQTPCYEITKFVNKVCGKD